MGKKDGGKTNVDVTCRCGAELHNCAFGSSFACRCGRTITIDDKGDVAISKKQPEATNGAREPKDATKLAEPGDPISSPEHKEPQTGTAELPLEDKKGERAKEAKTALDAHDRDLLARSITDRISTLVALAKKNKDEGYVKEAKALERDAEILRTDVLPLYTMTTLPIPFSAESEARAALKKVVRVRLTETSRLMLGITDWLPNKMQTTIISEATNTLTQDLLAILLKIVEEARAQGALDRTVDSAAIVEREVRGAFANQAK